MDCAHCDEAHEVLQELVVARRDAAEVFEFVEEPFDDVAFGVEGPIAGMGSASVVPWGDDGCGPGLQDCIMEVFGIVGPVRNDGPAWDAFDQRGTE